MSLFLNLGNLVVHLTANAAKFEKQMKRAEKTMTKVSKKMGALGRKMSIGITAPLTAIGVLAVRSFAKFDDAMTKSTAIMGNMTDQMRMKMEQTARTISRNGVTSAEELAKSYFFLASAGLNAAQSIAALATVEKFAVAGAFDMALATDLLTDAQSALGLTVKDTHQNMLNMVKVSDILVKANTLANASVEQFSKALTSKAAASMRNLNMDMEKGVAILAAFADQGIKGELAGERLTIVLRDLQVAAIKNKDVWQKMGIATFDATGKMRDGADIVENLEKKFKGMSDQQKKTTAIMLGFQMRSFSAIESLLGMSDKIRMYERELKKAGGTTETVYRKQLKSLSSQLKILLNNITDVGIELGKTLVPIVKRLAEVLQGVINWWKSLDDHVRRQIVTIALYAATLGPVLLIMGKLVAMIGTMITLTRLLTVALAANPFLVVAIAIASLVAAMTIYSDVVGDAAEGTGALGKSLAVVKSASEQLTDAQARLNRAVSLKDLKAEVQARQQQITILKEFSIEMGKAKLAGELQIVVTKELTGMMKKAGLETEEMGGKLIRHAQTAATGALVYINRWEGYRKVTRDTGKEVLNLADFNERLEKKIGELGKSAVLSTESQRDAMIRLREEHEKFIESLGKTTATPIFVTKGVEKTSKKMFDLARESKKIVNERVMALELESQLIGKSRGEQEKIIELAQLRGSLMAATADVAEHLGLTETEILSLVETIVKARQKEVDKINASLEANQKKRKDLAEEMKKWHELKRMGDQIGNAFASAFTDIVTGAKSAKDAVRDLAKAIAQIAIRQAIAKPIADAISFQIAGEAPKKSAKGNIFSGGNIKPFARGGIIDSPVSFPLANGNVGIAGEGGKEEGILPLDRDESGRLGVRMTGGGQRPIIVNFNDTKDADSFKRSQSQWAHKLTSAVRKG